MNVTPMEDFNFHSRFEVETLNGLILCDHYLPEEIHWKIFSYIPLAKLLKLSLVCKRWCNILKSDQFWLYIYNTQFPVRAVQLPWYVYYSYLVNNRNYENLLCNTNGQNSFNNWQIVKNYGDKFAIEDPPQGSDPLPSNVKDFNGKSSCFATSFNECAKLQKISLKDKRLLRYIIKKHRPHIYVSEWMAGRFDCGCFYHLGIYGLGEKSELELELARMNNSRVDIHHEFHEVREEVIRQWEGRSWKKVEILVDKYSEDITCLFFDHRGRDTQFWKGHYGSKMAGGVVKFVFDSIQPLCESECTQ